MNHEHMPSHLCHLNSVLHFSTGEAREESHATISANRQLKLVNSILFALGSVYICAPGCDPPGSAFLSHLSKPPRSGSPITDHPNMSTPPSKKRDKSTHAPSGVSVTQFILASLAFQFFLSYVITETWTWGYKSKWLYPRTWKYLIVT
jgi:hypothetical protein